MCSQGTVWPAEGPTQLGSAAPLQRIATQLEKRKRVGPHLCDEEAGGAAQHPSAELGDAAAVGRHQAQTHLQQQWRRHC